MGISPSKRVSATLSSSSDLTAACAAVYDQCLALTQHAFPGILPYQLSTAANLLHADLTTAGNHHQPLIAKWLKSPPNRLQVDRALQITLSRRRIVGEQEPAEPIVIIGLHEFNSFAIELITLAVVDNAAKAVRNRVPIGIGGIIGLGVLTHFGNHVIGTAVGAYALGVATCVYLGL